MLENNKMTKAPLLVTALVAGAALMGATLFRENMNDVAKNLKSMGAEALTAINDTANPAGFRKMFPR